MIDISSEYAFDKRHPFDFKLLDSEELFRLSAVRRTGFVVNEATGTGFLKLLEAVLKPPQAVKYCFRIRSTGRDEEILDFFHLDPAAEADPILALSRTYQAMGNN